MHINARKKWSHVFCKEKDTFYTKMTSKVVSLVDVLIYYENAVSF